MSLPTITLEFSPTTNPLAAPSWVNISAYLLAFETRAGRSYELGKIEAGTATIALDNADRRFDPAYTSGPYYGNLLPMRRMRLSATWSSTLYYLFSGFVEAWTPLQRGGSVVELEVPLVDAFTYFARSIVSVSDAVEKSGTKIGRILTALGYADSVLETGQSTMQDMDIANDNALQTIQDIADSENGLFFVGQNGTSYFYGRHYRLLNKSISSATFGDAVGELPYEELIFSFDDSEIYNEIRVTQAVTLTVGTASDSTSQAKYFKRTLEKTSYVSDSNEVTDAANWLLARYKEPAIRAERLTLSGQSDDTLWPYILGLGINDRITVRQRPWGGGNTIEQQVYIEHMRHALDARPGTDTVWRTTWQLSPAITQSYWILGDPSLSLLGSTTVLGY